MMFKAVSESVLKDGNYEQGVFHIFEPMLQATGGLTLSQVCAVTGLEGYTVQNWVKRGWVANPRGKKYLERQLSRILILNALRDALQLEQIVKILAYLNGSVEDQSDDIIPESRLFDYLCRVMGKVEKSGDLTPLGIRACVEDVTSDYGAQSEWVERLREGLHVMACACAAAGLRRESERLYRQVIENS